MLEIHTGLLFHGLEAVAADADGSREFGGRCGVTHLPFNSLPASGPGMGGGQISSTSSLVGSSCCQNGGGSGGSDAGDSQAQDAIEGGVVQKGSRLRAMVWLLTWMFPTLVEKWTVGDTQYSGIICPKGSRKP